jgi:hypothetical protein
VIGVPFLILGLFLLLAALFGDRVRGRDGGGVGTFLLAPLHPATWYAGMAILLGFWVELVAFTFAIAAFSSGASSLFFGIGFVLIGLAIEGCRMVARIERSRATLADPRPLRAHVYRPYGSGLRDFLFAIFLDVSRWRDVVYVFVAFPLTALELAVSAALWILSLGLLSVPIWYATGSLASVVGEAAAPSPALALALRRSHGASWRSTARSSAGSCAIRSSASSSAAWRRWKGAAGPSSTSRRASCAGSSAISTTGPSSAWSC